MHKDVSQNGPAVKPKPVSSFTEAARRLGVTREHLSRVRHGHRVSRRLSARYLHLTGQHLRKAA